MKGTTSRESNKKIRRDGKINKERRRWLSQLIIDKLKDLDWYITAGFAVASYLGKTRSASDLDITLREKDLEKFAERVGEEAEKRGIKKGKAVLYNKGFKKDFHGIYIDANNGISSNLGEKIEDKIYERKVGKTFLGERVYIATIEEIVALKAYLFRDKDKADLRRLESYAEENIDVDFLRELLEGWEKALTRDDIGVFKPEAIYKRLKKLGLLQGRLGKS